jgi:hypothetical protein
MALSPTGDLIVFLSAARLSRVAAATAHGYDLLEVVPQYKPNLFRQRDVRLQVCQKGSGIRA